MIMVLCMPNSNYILNFCFWLEKIDFSKSEMYARRQKSISLKLSRMSKKIFSWELRFIYSNIFSLKMNTEKYVISSPHYVVFQCNASHENHSHFAKKKMSINKFCNWLRYFHFFSNISLSYSYMSPEYFNLIFLIRWKIFLYI